MAALHSAFFLLAVDPSANTTLLGILSSIGSTVTELQKNIVAYSIALAAVGAMSMALLQTVKDLTSLREWFQRYRLRRLLLRRLVPDPDIPFTADKGRAHREEARKAMGPRVVDAESILIQLATAGDRSAFYQLQIEQMCGQIVAILPVLFDRPDKYQPLIRVLASAADPEDIATVLETPLDPNATTPEQKVAYAAARARLMNSAQRGIDGIQIRVGSEWQTFLRAVSLAFSILITALGIWKSTNLAGQHSWTLAFIALLGGVLGGFLAPVARDLVAAVQSLRP